MTLTDVLTIVAIICGPILAVQVQKWLERFKEKKRLKQEIFRILMATRSAPLSPQHVQALNMIDIGFYGKRKKHTRVAVAWKAYLDHLYNAPKDLKNPNYQTQMTVWQEATPDRLTALLFEMSKALHYSFDKVHIKRGGYTPQLYGEAEMAQYNLRNSLGDLFAGKTSIPVRIEKDVSTDSSKQETDIPKKD